MIDAAVKAHRARYGDEEIKYEWATAKIQKVDLSSDMISFFIVMCYATFTVQYIVTDGIATEVKDSRTPENASKQEAIKGAERYYNKAWTRTLIDPKPLQICQCMSFEPVSYMAVRMSSPGLDQDLGLINNFILRGQLPLQNRASARPVAEV